MGNNQTPNVLVCVTSWAAQVDSNKIRSKSLINHFHNNKGLKKSKKSENNKKCDGLYNIYMSNSDWSNTVDQFSAYLFILLHARGCETQRTIECMHKSTKIQNPSNRTRSIKSVEDAHEHLK